ncbi:hypothetical protein K438DRAFT_2104673 [Mycena galopus ATCC 62051]|nr:hypothetical protein K438DRAFT_2104673 [Mycena galopus ATCC 62051]
MYQGTNGPPEGHGYADLTPRHSSRVIKCQRPTCGKPLPAGVNLFMLHDTKGSSEGFGVCPDCKLYYERKHGGIVCEQRGDDAVNVVSRTEAGPSNQHGNTVPSYSRTSDSLNYGLGASMLHAGSYPRHSSSGLMGPPPLPSTGYMGTSSGPDVRLPSRPRSHRTLTHLGSSSTSFTGHGYTQNHGSYLDVRARSQQLAYAPTSDHRIMLEFRGVIRKPGRANAEIIGDMYRVVDKVRVSVGAGEIKVMAWDNLGPRWAQHTGNYPLNIDDCTIHNKDWVEIIAIRNPDTNAIADRFYKPNPKSPSQPTFKTAKFRVDLCIPYAIYSAFLEHDAERKAQSATQTSDPTRGNAHPKSRQTPQSRGSSSRPLPSAVSRCSNVEQSTASDSVVLNPASFASEPLFQPVDEEKENVLSFNAYDELESTSTRNFKDVQSSESAAKISVPALSKKAFVKALTQQTTPSRKEMGPLTSLAKPRTLEDLLSSSGTFDSFLMDPPMDVVLHLDLSPKAQKRGAFKMATFGRSSKPMFRTMSREICGKRTFYEEKDKSNTDIVHYLPCPFGTQTADLAVEIKCNIWAASLLEDVYAGIDHFIANSPAKPPADLPRMRFVRVAFATEGKQANGGDQSRPRSIFLVEENIEESTEGPFRKYINNQAPMPTRGVLFDHKNRNRALFLAFTQHWQYKRTHGLAFVSDYQGGDTLLTDPQIISHPALGDIFGSGNIPSGCNTFTTFHQCNSYCEYFQIANNFDFPVDMSISAANTTSTRSTTKRKAEEDLEQHVQKHVVRAFTPLERPRQFLNGFQNRLFAHLRDECKTILSFNAYTKKLAVVIMWVALESIEVVVSAVLDESSIARVCPSTQGRDVEGKGDGACSTVNLKRNPPWVHVRSSFTGRCDALVTSQREHRTHSAAKTAMVKEVVPPSGVSRGGRVSGAGDMHRDGDDLASP